MDKPFLEHTPIHTSCGDCIFQTKEDNHQLSCQFGRLSIFLDNKEAVLIRHKWVSDYNNKWCLCEYHGDRFAGCLEMKEKVDKVDKEEECSFYLINRLCSRCRNTFWAKKVEKEKGPVNLKDEVIEETKLRLSFVIYVSKDTNLDDFAQVVKDINNQTLLPIEIIVVNHGNKSLNPILIESKVPWRIVSLVNNDVPAYYALDEAYKHIKGQYFAQVYLPCTLSPQTLSSIDFDLNEKLFKFFTLSFKDNPNLTVFQSYIGNKLKGNNPIQFKGEEAITEGLLPKIKYLAKQANKEHLCATI